LVLTLVLAEGSSFKPGLKLDIIVAVFFALLLGFEPSFGLKLNFKA